ncbi:MAG: hypothetical protein CMJ64_29715 [Planctomycetaceae bacterium]|nr:hypothetical protein [Planctomycetaceae bacterium]
MSTINEVLYLEPGLAGTPMTVEEFDAVTECDELYVYQLINGVLVVNPPPSIGERGPNDLLGYLLRAYGEQHSQGKALTYTAPEQTLRTVNRRRADRAIWAGFDHVPDIDSTPPTITIEFVSESLRDRRRDYEVKRDEYLEVGIAKYWVIDRFQRKMTVFRHGDKGYAQVIVQEEETYQTPLLPGFELPLARILAEADLVEGADCYFVST